jgi:hypothetical protein
MGYFELIKLGSVSEKPGMKDRAVLYSSFLNGESINELGPESGFPEEPRHRVGFSHPSLFNALSQNVTEENSRHKKVVPVHTQPALLITDVVVMGRETHFPNLKPQAHFPSYATDKHRLRADAFLAHWRSQL